DHVDVIGGLSRKGERAARVYVGIIDERPGLVADRVVGDRGRHGSRDRHVARAYAHRGGGCNHLGLDGRIVVRGDAHVTVDVDRRISDHARGDVVVDDVVHV